jgi:hypothetical protein
MRSIVVTTYFLTVAVRLVYLLRTYIFFLRQKQICTFLLPVVLLILFPAIAQKISERQFPALRGDRDYSCK